MIKPYQSHIPQISEDVFVAENATIIGEVRIGAQSSVWYQAVLRGDVGAIVIGERTNIQDGAILHCTSGRSQTLVGNEVVVGHRAILHGCTVHDQALIGMGAIVLDEALVPSHTVVAAGALITEKMVLESGFLYAGVPAKKIKALSPQQIQLIQLAALSYIEKARFH